MNDPPFPFVRNGQYPPADGLLQQVPVFCSKKHRPLCSQFYANAAKKPGFHTCPYGFASYTVKADANTITYTSLRVAEHSVRSKLKIMEGTDDVPKFPAHMVVRAARNWQDTDQAHQKVEALNTSVAQSNRFINLTIHEVRKLNAMIKAGAETLSREVDLVHTVLDRDAIQRWQKEIFHTSALVSMRLDAFDFHANPQRITSKTPQPISVHKKFYKIAQCLQPQGFSRIVLDGSCNLAVLGWDVFEMLPFVLLENALKYSPPQGAINVLFDQTMNSLVVHVSSLGPSLIGGEDQRITTEGYRGENARTLFTGSGLGLTLAQQICTLHHIRMTFHSDSPQTTYKNVPYSMFKVKLEFTSSTLTKAGDIERQLW